ncbi:MAG: phage major capsid protein [Bacilli bacterium]|nr:phage major capsid protein [Bacilli bacterium]
MNTVYANEVLASQLKDNLTTLINHRALMKIDTSLTEEAGMIKKINTYTYNGTAEKVAKGAKNTSFGALTFVANSYEVKVAQHTWKYFDEDVMQDSAIVEYGLKGGANVMVNDMVADFYKEAAKATLTQEFPKNGFNYDSVVDAIAKMNLESEAGINLLINPSLKAEVRKDDDFKAKQLGQILIDGAIGTISGIPVVVSKAVPADTAYVLDSQAITCFMKKDAMTEQDRDIETRENIVVMSQVEVVALTDATKIVKMTRASA